MPAHGRRDGIVVGTTLLADARTVLLAAGVTSLGVIAAMATTSASITVATLYLQNQLGLAPMETGALLITFSILVVAGSVLAPRLLGTLGWGPALGFGLGTVAIGTAVLVAWPTGLDAEELMQRR